MSQIIQSTAALDALTSSTFPQLMTNSAPFAFELIKGRF